VLWAHPDLERVRSHAAASSRDVYRNGWSGLTSADAETAGRELLVRLGRLRAVKFGTGGRPSVRYLVNPDLKRQRAETA
jgi:hypothetical protein